MTKIRLLVATGLACCSLGFGDQALAQVNFVLSAPGAQSSPVQADPGSLTETLDGFSTGFTPTSGSLAVGTYATSTPSMTIYNPDQYGGAGGTGKYIGTGYANPPINNGQEYLSVNLTPSKYVGFWWSAGSGGNLVKIFDNSNALLGTFNTASLTSLLSGPTVVAADGNTYASNLYFGNPNYTPKPNTGEAYAYVNLTLSDPSLVFTKIEFSGKGFEFDNVTVSDKYFNPAPGPLPILGCGAAFGWSRRLRRRIKESS